MLFKLFESDTESAIIKSNAAIALGDIAIAFSTIIDDNSDRLYEGLAARDLNIKKNTLMVLTHLVGWSKLCDLELLSNLGITRFSTA